MMTIKAAIVVKSILLNRRIGKLLLIQRSNDDSIDAGVWENAGGSLNDGETLPMALRREIFEETGLTDITIGKPAYVTLIAKKDPYIIIAYYCETDSVAITLSDEHQSYRWVDKDECRRMLRGGIKQDFLKNKIFEMSWTNEKQ